MKSFFSKTRLFVGIVLSLTIYKYNETPKFAHFTSGLIKDTI